jgi:hypothetical protein
MFKSNKSPAANLSKVITKIETIDTFLKNNDLRLLKAKINSLEVKIKKIEEVLEILEKADLSNVDYTIEYFQDKEPTKEPTVP